MSGFFLAAVRCFLFALGALAAAGIWVPPGWWRPLARLGAALLLGLMVLFFGPTKLIPMLFAIGTLYFAIARPAAFGLG